VCEQHAMSSVHGTEYAYGTVCMEQRMGNDVHGTVNAWSVSACGTECHGAVSAVCGCRTLNSVT
jgi:hypothetical protein